MVIKLDDKFLESLLAVNEDWCTKYIGEYHLKSEFKVAAKVYALKFSGQKYVTNEWVKHITRSLKNFLYDKSKIQEMEANGQEPYQEAMLAFGDTDPVSDGKFGELILFLLVESVLRAPMMVHKISNLMNRNDQAKGADNLFLGTYKGERTIFLGESKIKTRYNEAVIDALESLNRFHQLNDSALTDQEFIVSRSSLRTDLSQEQLDYLYSVLDPAHEEHRNTNKAHPIFIMYNFDEIQTIEVECKNNIHGDELLKNRLMTWMDKEFHVLKEKLKGFQELQSVDLIFFLIPVKDTNSFRHLMYNTIHGTSYRKKA
jgi:hypothetical protein